MINNNKKYLGVALATLTAATLVAAPQAMAKAKVAPAVVASKTDVLEAQVRVMQDEIASLRAQVNSARPAAADHTPWPPAARALVRAPDGLKIALGALSLAPDAYRLTVSTPAAIKQSPSPALIA